MHGTTQQRLMTVGTYMQLLSLPRVGVCMQGAFLVGREVNYPAVCETAADIAKGMLQLHSMNVVHSDLKVSQTTRPRQVAPQVERAAGAQQWRGATQRRCLCDSVLAGLFNEMLVNLFSFDLN